MQNDSWIRLFQRIPQSYHNKLMLVTTSGREVNLQDIFRMEEDLIVIRGRMAGTTDQATVLFIPFNQVNYIGFRVEVKEEEIQKMLSGDGTSTPVSPRVEASAPARPPAAEAPEPPLAPAAPAPAAAAAPATSGKAALLERLRRARTGSGDASKGDG